MAESNPSAFSEFCKACLFLLVLPWMPLVLEFLCTVTIDAPANRYLERPSLVITASLLAAGVGVASKYRPVFGFYLTIAVLLAAMYGAVQAGSHGAEAKAAKTKNAVNLEQTVEKPAKEQPPLTTASPTPTFWDKLDMDDFAGKISWGVMLVTSATLVVERMIRHLFYKETYKFEWSK